MLKPSLNFVATVRVCLCDLLPEYRLIYLITFWIKQLQILFLTCEPFSIREKTHQLLFSV